MKENKIILSHGSGGELMHSLIKDIFVKKFKNDILIKLLDSAVIDFGKFDLCFTTDSYTVDPIFFKGGDIGKLAICGTINDLSVSGAKPLYISSSFIIEEGFEIEKLKKIVDSMKKIAEKTKVKIITGDTKVVEKGKVDKIFINTSGIGIKDKKIALDPGRIKVGDLVIINGTIAEHGISVMLSRNQFNIEANIKSDCAPLNKLIEEILKSSKNIKFMRDPTRGGISSVLNEIVKNQKFGILIYEEKIPIKTEVISICELLGYDPLQVANEGKVIIIVDRKDGEKIKNIMRKNKYGRKAEIIGEVISKPEGKVLMKTLTGSIRVVEAPIGEMFPRIC